MWTAKNSTGFMHRDIPMEDGARFLYRGSEESPIPVWTYVGTTETFIEDYLDGGLRATFVNVDGTVFVWNHFAVDTLDGLAVTQIGTVAANDASRLPDPGRNHALFWKRRGRQPVSSRLFQAERHCVLCPASAGNCFSRR